MGIHEAKRTAFRFLRIKDQEGRRHTGAADWSDASVISFIDRLKQQ
jgi:hypothetical protein